MQKTLIQIEKDSNEFINISLLLSAKIINKEEKFWILFIMAIADKEKELYYKCKDKQHAIEILNNLTNQN